MNKVEIIVGAVISLLIIGLFLLMFAAPVSEIQFYNNKSIACEKSSSFGLGAPVSYKCYKAIPIK